MVEPYNRTVAQSSRGAEPESRREAKLNSRAQARVDEQVEVGIVIEE